MALPAGLIAELGGAPARRKMILLGYAADGFPIYNQYGHTDPKDAKSPLKKLRPSFSLKKARARPAAPAGRYDGTFTVDYQYVAAPATSTTATRFEVTTEYPAGIYHYSLSDRFLCPAQFFTAAGRKPSCRPVPDRAAPRGLRGPPARLRLPPPRGGPLLRCSRFPTAALRRNYRGKRRQYLTPAAGRCACPEPGAQGEHNERELREPENHQRHERALHETVTVQADAERFSRRTTTSRHHVAADSQRHLRAFGAQFPPARVQANRHQSTMSSAPFFLRVPAPEAAPALVGPNSPSIVRQS